MNTRMIWILMVVAIASSASAFAECGDTATDLEKNFETAVAAPSTSDSGNSTTSGVIQGGETPVSPSSQVPNK